MEGVIRLTKSYMGDPIGTEYKMGVTSKMTAWQIIRDNGATDYIPKSYAEFIDPLGAMLGPPAAFSTEAPAVPKDKIIKMSLGDNQIQLSTITEGHLPSSKVDHVIEIFPDDTWDKEYHSLIPEVDELYYWNPDLLEAVIVAHKTKDRLLLTGMPATGKSTAHEQYCAIIRQPFFKINGKEGLEPSSFVGSLGQDEDGIWRWKDGTLPTCMKLGFYLDMDEVFKIPATIQMVMQTVYEVGGNLVLDDKPGTLKEKLIRPDEKFRLNATDNVRGTGDNFAMFSSTQMQDLSSIDRFNMYFEVPYMPEVVEVSVFKRRFPDINEVTIRKIVQVANNIRNSFKYNDVAVTFSPRGIKAMCNYMMHGLPINTAFELAYLNKLAADNEVETVKKFMETANL